MRLALCALCLLISCGGSPASDSKAEDPPRAAPQPASVAAPESATDADSTATVFYLHPTLDYMVPIKRAIFKTDDEVNRVKQMIDLLTIPPDPEQGLALWPNATYVREVFLLDDGRVVVDLDPSLVQFAGGGTARELFMVYSLVNTLLRNVPDSRGVVILVDGQPRDTLLGQVDIEGTLSARPDLVIESARDEIEVEDLH